MIWQKWGMPISSSADIHTRLLCGLPADRFLSILGVSGGLLMRIPGLLMQSFPLRNIKLKSISSVLNMMLNRLPEHRKHAGLPAAYAEMTRQGVSLDDLKQKQINEAAKDNLDIGKSRNPKKMTPMQINIVIPVQEMIWKAKPVSPIRKKPGKPKPVEEK